MQEGAGVPQEQIQDDTGLSPADERGSAVTP
jgi:hypothetical protein